MGKWPPKRSTTRVTRRAALVGLAGAMVSPPVADAADGEPLRRLAASGGRIYGAAAESGVLRGDPRYRAAFARECGLLVPENALKWAALRPSPDRFDFVEADWLADFARRNSMAFRGHTLLWHNALPPWFERTVDAANAERFLVEHITVVCARYAKRMHSWDVVNEAVSNDRTSRDGLRATPWLKLLGPGYIESAFGTAHAADPTARLVYNDYGLELDAEDDAFRRARVLRLLRELKEKGVPIHALGIQSHLEIGRAPFDKGKFGAFLADVAALGLEIIISELDVNDRRLGKDIVMRDAEVATAYGDYLAVALDQPMVKMVITWGLSDKYSWLNSDAAEKRSDDLAVRGLPLDAALAQKPAYVALGAALAKPAALR